MNNRETALIKSANAKDKALISSQMKLKKADRDQKAIDLAKKKIEGRNTWLNGELINKPIGPYFKKPKHTLLLNTIEDIDTHWPSITTLYKSPNFEIYGPEEVMTELKTRLQAYENRYNANAILNELIGISPIVVRYSLMDHILSKYYQIQEPYIDESWALEYWPVDEEVKKIGHYLRLTPEPMSHRLFAGIRILYYNLLINGQEQNLKSKEVPKFAYKMLQEYVKVIPADVEFSEDLKKIAES